MWWTAPKEQQTVFVEVGQAITDQAYEVSAALEAQYFAEMEGKLAINEVDLSAFRDATASSYDDYIDAEGDEYLAIIRAAAK